MLELLLMATAITAPLQGCVQASTLLQPLTWSAPSHLVYGQYRDPKSGCDPTVDLFDHVLLTSETVFGFSTAVLDPRSLPTCGRVQLDFESPGTKDSLRSLVIDTGVDCPEAMSSNGSGERPFTSPIWVQFPASLLLTSGCLLADCATPFVLPCETCAITPQMPPLVPVPEPASLLLVASGLLLVARLAKACKP